MQPSRHIAKKNFGQHFLKDARVLKRIVEISHITPQDRILEIGPGKGALTKRLLATGAHVVAVEKDRDLIPLLNEIFAAEIAARQLSIVNDDIMNWVATQKMLLDHSYKVVANIPYNITGSLIEALLTTPSQPTDMTLLIQKEVADRIVARDGKGSILAWAVHYFGTPKHGFTVSKQAFSPPPKVTSAVITINGINHGQKGISEKAFFAITKSAFAHKRKQLVKNLKETVSEPLLRNALDSLKLSPDVRAEDIPWGIWIALVKKLI